MADVFGRKQILAKKPITADMCTIIWGGSAVSSATNVSLQYSQQVTRRRTLGGNGNPVAVIYPSQPQGSLSIQRLVAESADKIFNPSRPGWNICDGTADLDVHFNGASAYENCTTTGNSYKISGATVTSYTLSAEAESLTVADGIQIEFLQLSVVER